VRIAHPNRRVQASAQTVAAAPAAGHIDQGRLAWVNLHERLDLSDPARQAGHTRLAGRLVHLCPQHSWFGLAGGGGAHIDDGRMLKVLLDGTLLGRADHRVAIFLRKRRWELNVE
jgi:hypothetical protein